MAYSEEQSRGKSHEPARWVQRQIDETTGTVALRAPSLLMHAEAIRAGTGRGVLPCYVGDAHPVLERLGAPIPELGATYWMVVHCISAAPLACALRSTGCDRLSSSSVTSSRELLSCRLRQAVPRSTDKRRGWPWKSGL